MPGGLARVVALRRLPKLPEVVGISVRAHAGQATCTGAAILLDRASLSGKVPEWARSSATPLHTPPDRGGGPRLKGGSAFEMTEVEEKKHGRERRDQRSPPHHTAAGSRSHAAGDAGGARHHHAPVAGGRRPLR